MQRRYSRAAEGRRSGSIQGAYNGGVFIRLSWAPIFRYLIPARVSLPRASSPNRFCRPSLSKRSWPPGCVFFFPSFLFCFFFESTGLVLFRWP